MLRKSKAAKKVEEEVQELEKMEHEVHELEASHQKLKERVAELESPHRHDWTTYVGLSTAIMAVFAIYASLQSNFSINYALIFQLRASDQWTQYQAAREKEHLFTTSLNDIVDRNPADPSISALIPMHPPTSAKAPPPGADKAPAIVRAKSAGDRGREYLTKAWEEQTKEQQRTKDALKLQTTSKGLFDCHEVFEKSSGFLEVAITVGAAAGLIRMKKLWFLSMLIGVFGVAILSLAALQLRTITLEDKASQASAAKSAKSSAQGSQKVKSESPATG
jgi:hypothetical protein